MKVRAIAASACGNMFVMLVGFLVLFPIVAPWLLKALRFVLESLNSV
jgi:hypothetical protein